jgi:hypothetical protein
LQVPPVTQLELDTESLALETVNDRGDWGFIELEIVANETAGKELVEDERSEKGEAWIIIYSLVELF